MKSSTVKVKLAKRDLFPQVETSTLYVRPLSRSRERASLILILWTALLLVAAPWAHAEKADRDMPINLESDTATVDDARKISIYEGNVILTQGTLKIHADKLVVTEDAEGFQRGTAYGNPASFRQKREGYDEYIEGYALRIEYDQKKDLVQLFNQASMKRGLDEAHGNYISYDGKTEFFQVLGGKEAATANNPHGRVRTVIQPKQKTDAPAAQPASLKPAESIANPRNE